MNDCSICCEKINQSNHKKVQCPFCDFNSCRTCVQTYLLSMSSDPHCMNCKNLWTRDFIDESCTKVFRDGKLKNHRETILFERERCLLPQTQEAASRVVQARNIDKLIDQQRELIQEISRTINKLESDKWRLRNGATTDQVASGEKRIFVRKCPVNECRGFLSTRWKCQICENNICQECNEIKKPNEEHTCDPNNVETVKMLAKDTKPCPKCGTMIFKISGCSQMWCPDCHTAFDWNTMRIETGRIHNPHFYEFQRKGGGPAPRENGDIPCGGLPDYRELVRFLGFDRRLTPHHPGPLINDIVGIHRLILHMQNVEIRQEFDTNNESMRVSYLLNEMSEENMKIILQKNEKRREKTRDINNVLRMFCDVCSDWFRQLILKVISKEEFMTNAETIRAYVHDVLTKIHKRYSCSTVWISDKWVIERNYYKKIVIPVEQNI